MFCLQSEEIINIYKEDIQEFTRTIRDDTKKAIETKVGPNSSQLTKQLGEKLSGMLAVINQAKESNQDSSSPSSSSQETRLREQEEQRAALLQSLFVPSFLPLDPLILILPAIWTPLDSHSFLKIFLRSNEIHCNRRRSRMGS
jgi:hypothetical protein